AGTAALFAVPAVLLVLRPGHLDALIIKAGQPASWVALLLAAVGAGWYLRRATGRLSLHVVAALGLALGLLSGCAAGIWEPRGWAAYHTLTVAWTLAAAVLLAAGWRWAAGEGSASEGRNAAEGTAVRAWLTALMLLVAGLAVRGVGQDPVGLAW